MTSLIRLAKLGLQRRRDSLLVVAAGTLTVAAGTGLTWASAYLISKAAQRPPVLSLMVAIVLVRAFALSRAALRYAERLVAHDAALRLLAGVRTWFFRALEPQAPSGLALFRRGDLLERVVAEVESLQDFFVRSLAPFAVAALWALVVVAVTAWYFPPAALVMGVGLAFGGVLAPLALQALARSTSAWRASLKAELSARLVELFEGAGDLLAFGADETWREEVGRLDREIRRLDGRDSVLKGLGEGATLTLSVLTAAAMLVVAIPAVRAGTLNGTLLAALALLPLAAFEAVLPLSGALQDLSGHLLVAERVLGLADARPPVQEPAGDAKSATFGAVTLEGARLAFEGTLRPVLDRVDLRLEPGRRVALVGPSGAGKTSLANVLVRFRDLDSGRACLAGQDLRELRSEEVRRVVGLVPQQVHVFNTTVFENVRLARPEASRLEIEEAAARARLSDWIASLPRGWDTQVGERGLKVSGGERQRMALARALLARHPILILDEPTAQLDPENASRFMDDLLSASEPSTLLVITHRLYAMERMDEVVVLDQGRVVEQGSHADLVRRREGLYRQLWGQAEDGALDVGPGGPVLSR